MRTVDPGTDFQSWRAAARRLLGEKVSPGEVLWGKEEEGLFGGMDGAVRSNAPVMQAVKVPADFVPLAENVACHADPQRWSLLYRISWRLTWGEEKHLLRIASDPDVARANTLAKNVRREIHKMHAFVRFKLVSTDEAGRERYAAWFEPDHEVVEAASPFFRNRFANMDWSIFTPKGCAHWIGGELSFAPGIERNPIEDPDALEAAWSTYYRSIFNPARLKVKMMTSEMPKRYWKNLPEAAQIDELINSSRSRMETMIAREGRPGKAMPGHPYLNRLKEMSVEQPESTPTAEALGLDELKRLVGNCRACPLWQHATCAVFGEGPPQARVMIVGEQPGDREDVAGRVFVGPAGQLLDRALTEAGLERKNAYLTNAVKHFKWTPRGKIRLHKSPDSGEIEACRPWLLGELRSVAPDVLVILGATAAKSLLGKTVSVTKMRGVIEAPHLAKRVILTVHPSYLLRLPDEAKKKEKYARFVEDLGLAG